MPFFWQGKIVDPRNDEFAEHLSLQRFRTIENAASEEVSIGWVTPADPTGDNFSTEDLDGGVGTWLRLRIDKKSMPMKWLQIHRDAAEKARGKKLSAKERRELKDDLMDQLLPRVLPTITLVDALLFEERKTVLLFATSKSAKEAFTKLFFETFSLQLEPGDPLQAGLNSDLSNDDKHALERVNPIRWPNTTLEGGPSKPVTVPRPVIQKAPEPKDEALEGAEDAVVEESVVTDDVIAADEPQAAVEEPVAEATAQEPEPTEIESLENEA